MSLLIRSDEIGFDMHGPGFRAKNAALMQPGPYLQFSATGPSG
jgi:hypothetical protein